MPAAAPAAYQNYRVRVQLENTSNPILSVSLTEKFLYSDEDSGPNACDNSSTYGYFCFGPEGGFSAFDPGKPVVYLYPTKKTDVSVHIFPDSVRRISTGVRRWMERDGISRWHAHQSK
jgi:hypothetical protein